MDLVAQNVFFFVIAAGMVAGAIRVVTTRNVVHAALWLVLVLAGAAAQFILAIAEFTAIVQVLVYIGAIVVLFLFGIMLTRAPLGNSLEMDRPLALRGAVVAGLMLVLLGGVLIDTWGDDEFNFEAAGGEVGAEMAAVDADVAAADSGETLVAANSAQGSGSFAVNGSNTATVSDSIFRDYLIAFEAISLLLLAALIGAVCLARRD